MVKALKLLSGSWVHGYIVCRLWRWLQAVEAGCRLWRLAAGGGGWPQAVEAGSRLWRLAAGCGGWLPSQFLNG